MTDWTSLAVKADTKERFNELKNGSDKSGDELLTDLLNSYNGDSRDVQLGAGYEEIASHIAEGLGDELDITVEMSEDEKTAKVLADRLIDRLKGIDEDVRNAAYEGSKEAIEEVAR